MCTTGSEEEDADPQEDQDPVDEQAQFSALLEDSAEDLYENAPCGYLSTLLDGRIAKINTTLLDWLGYERGEPSSSPPAITP